MTATTKEYIHPKWASDGDTYIVEGQGGKELLLRIVHDCDPMSPREWDNVGTMVCWHRRYSLGDNHSYDEPRDFLINLCRKVSDEDIILYFKKEKPDYLKLEYDKSGREWVLYEYDSYLKNWYVAGTYAAPLNRSKQNIGLLADDIRENMQNNDLIALASKDNAILPLYLYDHSGITISTGKFSCPWDSGQVGWIYVSKEKVFEEKLGWISPELRATRDPKILNDRKNWEFPTEENWEKIAECCLESEVQVYDDYLTGNVYGYQLFEIDEADDYEDAIDGEEIDSCYGFYGDSILDEFRIIREV